MPSWWKHESQSSQAISQDSAVDALRYVVIDTELTSLDSRTNRLLSVGAIAMHGASIQLGNQFYRLINPGVSIPAESVVIHRLRAEDVVGGEDPKQCLDDLLQFIQGAVLVGHFVDIELKILGKEMGQSGHKINNPAIDTARVHQWILRRGPYSEELSVQLEKMDLATLAKFYSLEVQDAHHALSDAFLTAQIWQKMLYTLQASGVRNLRKLLSVGGA